MMRWVRLPFLLALIFAGTFSCRSKEERVKHETGSPAGAPVLPGGPETMDARLPRSVGPWNRSDQARVVTAQNIFNYMDGAGELYLGYRFQSLDVYEYSAAGQEDILAEIYRMETSDDAFGLLSNDWGGETCNLADSEQKEQGVAPPYRALYGEGLLRLWSDKIYARIMAYGVSEASKNAVMALGRAIVAGRNVAHQPALLKLLPEKVPPSYDLQPDHVCYFRSHLVLNSVYFLSTGNVLNLGRNTEAVTAIYRAPKGTTHGASSVRALLIRYPTDEQGRQALRHFLEVYVPEKVKGNVPKPSLGDEVLEIEDGWMGYRLKDACLFLVFECPGPEVARSYLNRVAGGPNGS